MEEFTQMIIKRTTQAFTDLIKNQKFKLKKFKNLHHKKKSKNIQKPYYPIQKKKKNAFSHKI